jgi:hypothetical protein
MARVIADEGVVLGDGYKSQIGVYTTSCIKNAIDSKWRQQHTVIYNPQGSLGLKQITSYKELQDLLDIYGEASASAGGWGADIGGGIFDQSANSNKTINMVYVQQFMSAAVLNLELSQYNSQETARVLLKEQVRKWYGQIGSQAALDIYNACGDKFVSSASTGGMFIVVITIRFTSIQAKNDFTAALGASGTVSGITLGINGALSMAEKNAKSGTTISITAKQYGGKSMNLQDAALGETDSLGVYQIQKCGSDSKKPGECDKLLTSIINYAESFSAQFRKGNNMIDKGNLFYFNPGYTDYSNVFGPVGEVNTNSQKIILSKLRDNYRDLVQDIALIDEYKSQVDNIFVNNTAGQISKSGILPLLIAYKADVLINNKNLYDSSQDLKNCLKYTAGCEEARKQIAANTVNLSPAYIKAADYLNYIKENSFTISNLLTIDNIKDPQKPRFKYINCDLIPLKPESGSWINALSGCGLSSGFLSIKYKSSLEDKNIEVAGFTYEVKINGQQYNLTYPRTTLYNLEFAEFVPSNESIFLKVKYEKCEANHSCTNNGEIIKQDQIKDYTGTNAYYLQQQELTTLYPAIMY